MEKLPIRLIKNRHIYVQLLRTDTKALYEQYTKDGNLTGHEVFIITHLPDRQVFFKKYKASEKYPSSEDFGKTAWSTGPDPKNAISKYQSLI